MPLIQPGKIERIRVPQSKSDFLNRLFGMLAKELLRPIEFEVDLKTLETLACHLLEFVRQTGAALRDDPGALRKVEILLQMTLHEANQGLKGTAAVQFDHLPI